MPIPPLPTTGSRKSSSLSPPGKRKNLPPPGSPRKLSPSRKLTGNLSGKDGDKNVLKGSGKLKPLPKIEAKVKSETAEDKKSKKRSE